MRFGEKVRQLRKAKRYDLRKLAEKVGVHFTYLSKVENEKLDFGDYPSDVLILKLADALEADVDELLILAKKIPERLRERVLERPEVFLRLAELDDEALNHVLSILDLGTAEQPHRRRRT